MRSTGLRWMVGCAAGLLFVGILATADAQVATSEPAGADGGADNLSWGGDLRIQQEQWDRVPLGTDRWPENNYLRVRSRLWGQWDPSDKLTVHARVINEFREFIKPDGVDAWEFPDEAVFDSLYVEARELLGGRLTLKVGRQDLIYGTGKVVLEGTPMDGSRSIYFNAAKASIALSDRTTLDLLAIYNEPEDDLALGSEDRDLRGAGIRESGGGVYLMDSSMPGLPVDVYYLFKREGRGLAGEAVRERADTHTVGLHLKPRFSDGVSGSLETASQFGEYGDNDIHAFMADAFLTWALPVAPAVKPAVSAGLYYLSGDDPATPDNEGWNPLWARYPQHSELYVYSLGKDGLPGYWSDLIMPHVSVSVSPAKNLTSCLLLGQMYSEENGPGGGDNRGLLATWRTSFTVVESLFGKNDALTGHMLIEALDPGDYHGTGGTAHFARWELNYAF